MVIFPIFRCLSTYPKMDDGRGSLGIPKANTVGATSVPTT